MPAGWVRPSRRWGGRPFRRSIVIDGDGATTAEDRAQLEDLGLAPELTGITDWINGPPPTLKSLRGKVVLVDFWTFGCINCRHVQPYVKAWYDHYGADGFAVLGVHTPELSFERDLDNVRDAVANAGRSISGRLRP